MTSSSMKSATKVHLMGKRGSQDDLETKPFLKKHNGQSVEKKTTEGFVDTLQREEVAVRKKTLSFSNFAIETEISDIINFFKNVEGVVRVQLAKDPNAWRKIKHMGRGYIEFASAEQAKKALQNKNGEYFCNCKILLEVAKYSPPEVMDLNVLDHTFWPEDYLGREVLPIGEDATYPDFVERVALRETTLFVANLSPQSKLSDIINFFNFYGGVASVRLIVNHVGKHVGYGFVEFTHSKFAMRELHRKNRAYLHDHKIFLYLAPRFPLTPKPKYNLAEMLWFEDCLQGEILPLEEDEAPSYFVEDVAVRDKTLSVGAVRDKTLFVEHISPQTEISRIIDFFKDVGEVVHVRLFVNCKGEHLGYGFVEFASSTEAKKALEMKNGEYLHGEKIFLDVYKEDPYPRRPMCCIDHKVWYEDYLRRETLLIEEDEENMTMERLVEEVAERKKTVFISNLVRRTGIRNITNLFKRLGEDVHVRLIVDHMGENVGCCFVEFASVNGAKKALQKKNSITLCSGNLILDVAEMTPYPLRPKYNLAEKIWYKDYLPLESCLIEEDNLETKPKMQKKIVMDMFCGKKTSFS